MPNIQKEIDQLALTQVAYAKLLGVDGSAVRRWIAGERNRPKTAERYTKLLLDNPDLLQQAWVNAGYPPEGPPISKAGRPVVKKEE